MGMADIEDHIQKAMLEDQFANLPGKGKPLNLEENPFVDPEWRLAHHMLKSSGFTPPWIEARQQILDKLESDRSDLANTWAWRLRALDENQPIPQIEVEWQRARRAFADKIESLNKEIFDYNLQTPSDRFQIPGLNLAREIAAITGVSR
jgi:DnaJ homolog subfamily C member 28